MERHRVKRLKPGVGFGTAMKFYCTAGRTGYNMAPYSVHMESQQFDLTPEAEKAQAYYESYCGSREGSSGRHLARVIYKRQGNNGMLCFNMSR